MKTLSKSPEVGRRFTAAATVAALFITSSFASADVLDDWNDAVLNAIRRENTSPPLAARNLAIVHLAIYEAVNSARTRTHEAAASAAAYRAASALFPSQRAAFDKLWRKQDLRFDSPSPLNGERAGMSGGNALMASSFPTSRRGHPSPFIPLHEPRSSRRKEAHSVLGKESQSLLTSAATVQGFNAQTPSEKSLPVEERGKQDASAIAVGFAFADALLEERSADAAQLGITYLPVTQSGAWRRTLPYFRPPDLPHWGCTKPFAIKRCDPFRPPPPPALTSREYALDFNEVKHRGARHSTARSVYETETARFWSDFTGTVTPPGHWNQIARTIAKNERISFRDKARLLALLNTALADAGIVCWEAKYKFNFWRPVTAIRRAAEDGNADTEADPAWEPLLTTPAFPEYASGHSTFSGAAGEVLFQFFGRDNLRFTVQSDSVPGVARSYESISSVVKEIGRSRVLGGIHFPSADSAGQIVGRAVGNYVFSREKERRLTVSALAN